MFELYLTACSNNGIQALEAEVRWDKSFSGCRSAVEYLWLSDPTYFCIFDIEIHSRTESFQNKYSLELFRNNLSDWFNILNNLGDTKISILFLTGKAF